MNNPVRFVQLRRPIAEVLESDGSGAGATSAANQFRDHILSLDQNTLTDRYRLRVVSQGELWNHGVKLGQLLGKSKRGPSDNPDVQQGDYYGGKWGMYLRAPDIWAELMGKYGDKFRPLGDIAEVRFGVKSGKDAFFFPIDASAESLEAIEDTDAFEAQFGASRQSVEDGTVKIVKCGEKHGELKPIESEFLEPFLFNLKDVTSPLFKKEQASKFIFLAPSFGFDLNSHTKAYVQWGEQNEYHEGSSCASRVTVTREWYDLTGHRRGDIFWSMRHGYRHVAPINSDNLQCNKAFFDINVKELNVSCLAGLLNSTWAVLSSRP